MTLASPAALRSELARLIDGLESVGSLFRSARGGERQTDFAGRLGISNVHLCRVERGDSLPSLELMRRLKDVMESSLDAKRF